MARIQTIVQLNADLVELLDREASRRAISRSALIRESIEAHLEDARERSITRRIVDGYTKVPPEQPDIWGDLDGLADVSSEESLIRLREEETRRGGPW